MRGVESVSWCQFAVALRAQNVIRRSLWRVVAPEQSHRRPNSVLYGGLTLCKPEGSGEGSPWPRAGAAGMSSKSVLECSFTLTNRTARAMFHPPLSGGDSLCDAGLRKLRQQPSRYHRALTTGISSHLVV